MKVRGIVLEVEKNNVTVLTCDGDYRRLPRRGNVQIGQEYCYSKSLQPWMAAAAMFMLLFASSLFFLATPAAPVAYITVDINPSIEIGVSVKHTVLSATPLNNDASALLSDLKLKDLPLDVALSVILSAAEEKQYINVENPAIVMSSTPAGRTNVDLGEIESIVENTLDKFLGENASLVAVAVVSANREQREEAQELGLSVGKYAVYQDVQKREINLPAEDLQTKGIGRALLDIGENPSDVLQNVNRKKNLPVPPSADQPENPGNVPENHPGQGDGPNPPVREQHQD